MNWMFPAAPAPVIDRLVDPLIPWPHVARSPATSPTGSRVHPPRRLIVSARATGPSGAAAGSANMAGMGPETRSTGSVDGRCRGCVSFVSFTVVTSCLVSGRQRQAVGGGFTRYAGPP